MQAGGLRRGSGATLPGAGGRGGGVPGAVLPGLLRQGQGEMEGGAAADGGGRPDAAAMAMDDAARRGQAHAGARESGRIVETLKRGEQAGPGGAAVETDAIVADIEHLLIRQAAAAA